jgi:hypothetical protein
LHDTHCVYVFHLQLLVDCCVAQACSSNGNACLPWYAAPLPACGLLQVGLGWFPSLHSVPLLKAHQKMVVRPGAALPETVGHSWWSLICGGELPSCQVSHSVANTSSLFWMTLISAFFNSWLVPCSRDLCKKLIATQSRNCTTFWNLKVHYHVYKSPARVQLEWLLMCLETVHEFFQC